MDKFQQYADIKRQIKDLEDQESLLKQSILQELEKNNTHKIDFDYGKFTYSCRTTYKYSEKINALQDKVKLAQLREQEKGIAKEIKSNYLTFTPKK